MKYEEKYHFFKEKYLRRVDLLILISHETGSFCIHVDWVIIS